jgi:hypothetical protein
MPCFYCGKRVSLVRQLNDADFCSEEHRRLYRELTRSALSRLGELDSPAAPKPKELVHSFTGTAAEADPVSDASISERTWAITSGQEAEAEAEVEPEVEPAAEPEPEPEFVPEPEPKFQEVARTGNGRVSEPKVTRDPSLPPEADFLRLQSPHPEPGRAARVRSRIPAEFASQGLAMLAASYEPPATAMQVCGPRHIVATYAPPLPSTRYAQAPLPIRPRIVLVRAPGAVRTTILKPGFVAYSGLALAGSRLTRWIERAEFGMAALVAPRPPATSAPLLLPVLSFTRDAAPRPTASEAMPRWAAPAWFAGAIEIRDFALSPIEEQAAEFAFAAKGFLSDILVPLPGHAHLRMADAAFLPQADLSLPALSEEAPILSIGVSPLALVESVRPVKREREMTIEALALELSIPFGVALPEIPAQMRVQAVITGTYFPTVRPKLFGPAPAKPADSPAEPFEFPTHLPEIEVPRVRLETIEPSFAPVDPAFARGATASAAAEAPITFGGRVELPAYSARASATKGLSEEGGFLVTESVPATRKAARIEAPCAEFPTAPRHPELAHHLATHFDGSFFQPAGPPEARRGRKPIRVLAYVPEGTATELPRPVAIHAALSLLEAAVVPRGIKPLQRRETRPAGTTEFMLPAAAGALIPPSALRPSSQAANLAELTPHPLAPPISRPKTSAGLPPYAMEMPIAPAPLPRMPRYSAGRALGSAEIIPAIVNASAAVLRMALPGAVAIQPANPISPSFAAVPRLYKLGGAELSTTGSGAKDSGAARRTRPVGSLTPKPDSAIVAGPGAFAPLTLTNGAPFPLATGSLNTRYATAACSWESFDSTATSIAPGPAVPIAVHLASGEAAPLYKSPTPRNVATDRAASFEPDFPIAVPEPPASADLLAAHRLEEIPAAALRTPARFGTTPVARLDALPEKEAEILQPAFVERIAAGSGLSGSGLQTRPPMRAAEVAESHNKWLVDAPLYLTSDVAKIETHLDPPSRAGLSGSGLLPGVRPSGPRMGQIERLPGATQEFPAQAPEHRTTAIAPAALFLITSETLPRVIGSLTGPQKDRLPAACNWQLFNAADAGIVPGPAAPTAVVLAAAPIAPLYKNPAPINAALRHTAPHSGDFPIAVPAPPRIAGLSLAHKLPEIPPAARPAVVRPGPRPITLTEVLPEAERELHHPVFGRGIVTWFRLTDSGYQSGAATRPSQNAGNRGKHLEAAPLYLTTDVARVERHLPLPATKSLQRTDLVPGVKAPEPRRGPLNGLPGATRDFPSHAPLNRQSTLATATLSLITGGNFALPPGARAGVKNGKPPVAIWMPPQAARIESAPARLAVLLKGAEPCFGRTIAWNVKSGGRSLDWIGLGQLSGTVRFDGVETNIRGVAWPTATAGTFQTAPKPKARLLPGSKSAPPFTTKFAQPEAIWPKSADFPYLLQAAALGKIGLPGFRDDRKSAEKTVRLKPAMRAVVRPSRLPNYRLEINRSMMPTGALWLSFEIPDYDDDGTCVMSPGFDRIERGLTMPSSRLATQPAGDFEWPWHVAMRFEPQQSAYYLEPGFDAMAVEPKVIQPEPVNSIPFEFQPVEGPSRLRGIFKGVFKSAVIIVPCLMFLQHNLRAAPASWSPRVPVERTGTGIGGSAWETIFWSGDCLKTGGAVNEGDRTREWSGQRTGPARESLQRGVEIRALAALQDVKKRGRIR